MVRQSQKRFKDFAMMQADTFKAKLYQELSLRHGEMIGGSKLARVLGYSTLSALCKALERGTLGLPVFHVAGRSGRFALTVDVVQWLMHNRQQAELHAAKTVPAQLKRNK
jgi:hypothetical protein